VPSRRDEIRAIAMGQFAERGYAGTSMRDIAEASNVLAGSLYSHFRSKAELVRDIVTRFYDELLPRQEAVLAADAEGISRFRMMIAEVFAVCARHRQEVTILHYDWATLSALPELGDVAQRSVRTLDLWRDAVAAGIEDGSIRPGVEPDLAVRLATGAIHSLLDTVRFASRPVRLDSVEEQVQFLQETLVQGLATRAADRTPAPSR
jgi:AcrR family transcriptional regulator